MQRIEQVVCQSPKAVEFQETFQIIIPFTSVKWNTNSKKPSNTTGFETKSYMILDKMK